MTYLKKTNTLDNVVKVILLLKYSGRYININKNNVNFQTFQDIYEHFTYMTKFLILTEVNKLF